MNPQALAPQDLARKAVVEVAHLPENELPVVIDMVDYLKRQRAHPNREFAATIVAQAKARATETSQLSREELIEQFGEALDAVRADAMAKGTATEGELEGD